MADEPTRDEPVDDPEEAPGTAEHRGPDTTVTAPDPDAVPDPEEGPPPEGYGGPTDEAPTDKRG